MLIRFYRRYRSYILEASVKGDLSYLTDVIGVDNFEELNEIIDTVDYYVEKGLVDKLKELLKRMEDTFCERSKSYYNDGYSFRKRFSRN